MEISTYAAWLEENHQDRKRLATARPEYVQSHLETQQELDHERRALLMTLSYSFVAEGTYWEHDYAARWCRHNISLMNGPCVGVHTYYPACPLVLETEYIEHTVYQGLERLKKRYIHSADHEHQGDWTFLWFGKTVTITDSGNTFSSKRQIVRDFWQPSQHSPGRKPGTKRGEGIEIALGLTQYAVCARLCA